MKNLTDKQRFIILSGAGGALSFVLFTLVVGGLLLLASGAETDFQHVGLPLITAFGFGLINGLAAGLAVFMKHGVNYPRIRSRLLWRLGLWCIVCALVFFR